MSYEVNLPETPLILKGSSESPTYFLNLTMAATSISLTNIVTLKHLKCCQEKLSIRIKKIRASK